MFQIGIYIFFLATLYFYTGWRGSLGYFWMAAFILSHWFLTRNFNLDYTKITVILGASLLITFEISRRMNIDPFAEDKFFNGIFSWIKKIASLANLIGLKPKVTIVDMKDSEGFRIAKSFLQANDWEGLECYLKEQLPNHRYQIIQAITSLKGQSLEFDAWIERCPESAMAYIVSGYHMIHWAWEARGGGSASSLNNKAIEQFFHRLSVAKMNFDSAIQLDNQFPEPYVGLIQIIMGSGIGREDLWEYFAKALMRCSDHYAAHSCMINALSEKWGGEKGEMFMVALKASGNAKNENPLVGILAEAHIEQWLYLRMCEQEIEAEIYFREKYVRDELQQAYEKIRHAKIENFDHVMAFNNFAFCFYLAGLNSMAKEALIKLDGQFIEHPWDYLNEPFMANFHAAYAIDHVLEKLEVVYGNLPDIIITKNDAEIENDGQATYITDVENHVNRRFFKATLIAPLSVILIICIYVSYSLAQIMHTEIGFLIGLKTISFEVFCFCYMGLLFVIIYNKNLLSKFLDRYPVIESSEALEMLKPIARSNMYSSLFALFFIALGALASVITLARLEVFESIIVVILLNVASFMMHGYSRVEKKVKQIECNDQNLEVELNRVLNSWMRKAFPDF